MANQRSIYFYATKADIRAILQKFEKGKSLRYVRFGNYETPDPPSYTSGLDLPSLGYTDKSESYFIDRYVVQNSEVPFSLRMIELNSGGICYSFSQLENRASVIFNPGGKSDEGYLLQGEFSTASFEDASQSLFRSFARLIRQNFTWVQGYWVSAEALILLQSGWRLTFNANMRMYDLKRPC